jgi:endoglucanase
MYDAATALSAKPVLLAEVGSTEVGGSKADWITSALGNELVRFPRVRALIWFDVNKEQPWNLNSSAGSLSAWLSASAQPQFEATADTLAGA